MMMEALKEIVRVDQDWVPSEPETSLYIRPFMFGTDEQWASTPITASSP